MQIQFSDFMSVYQYRVTLSYTPDTEESQDVICNLGLIVSDAVGKVTAQFFKAIGQLLSGQVLNVMTEQDFLSRTTVDLGRIVNRYIRSGLILAMRTGEFVACIEIFKHGVTRCYRTLPC